MTKQLQKRLDIAEARIEATEKRVDNSENRIHIKDGLTIMNVKDVKQIKDRVSMTEKEIAALKVSVNGIR